MNEKWSRFVKLALAIYVLSSATLLAGFVFKELNSANELPVFVTRTPDIQEAYLFAQSNPEVASVVPCFCGCMDSKGHLSLFDCFIDNNGDYDNHGSNCKICVDTALDSKNYVEQGFTKKEIVAYIEAEYQTDNSDLAAQMLTEITPIGTPDYGEEANVSYDEPVSSLSILIGFQNSINLSGQDEQRFIEVATTNDTACKYCCGIGTAGFGRSDGTLACGCAHNIAFGGLTKWLIENTDYTDSQIVNEIHRWRILFFPGPSVQEIMTDMGINPDIPSQVGGC